MERMFVFLGAVTGLAAVAMSAAAAHMLASRLDPAALASVRTAVQMQGWHALALLFCAVWASRGGLMVQIAGWCFFVGIVLFTGAIYAHALAELRMPAIAPAGGTVLMLGWLFVALSALTRRR